MRWHFRFAEWGLLITEQFWQHLKMSGREHFSVDGQTLLKIGLRLSCFVHEFDVVAGWVTWQAEFSFDNKKFIRSGETSERSFWVNCWLACRCVPNSARLKKLFRYDTVSLHLSSSLPPLPTFHDIRMKQKVEWICGAFQLLDPLKTCYSLRLRHSFRMIKMGIVQYQPNALGCRVSYNLFLAINFIPNGMVCFDFLNMSAL